jgi:hypothetical protein
VYACRRAGRGAPQHWATCTASSCCQLRLQGTGVHGQLLAASNTAAPAPAQACSAPACNATHQRPRLANRAQLVAINSRSPRAVVVAAPVRVGGACSSAGVAHHRGAAVRCRPAAAHATGRAARDAQVDAVLIVEQPKPALHGQLLAGVARPPQHAALRVAPAPGGAVVGAHHAKLVAGLCTPVAPQAGVVVRVACTAHASHILEILQGCTLQRHCTPTEE